MCFIESSFSLHSSEKIIVISYLFFVNTTDRQVTLFNLLSYNAFI